MCLSSSHTKHGETWFRSALHTTVSSFWFCDSCSIIHLLKCIPTPPWCMPGGLSCSPVPPAIENTNRVSKCMLVILSVWFLPENTLCWNFCGMLSISYAAVFGCCCIFVIPMRIQRSCAMQKSQEDRASTATMAFNTNNKCISRQSVLVVFCETLCECKCWTKIYRDIQDSSTELWHWHSYSHKRH